MAGNSEISISAPKTELGREAGARSHNAYDTLSNLAPGWRRLGVVAGNLGCNTQFMGRTVLAATFAGLDRRQDAERERMAVMRMAPFLSTERFAAQFGTQQAREHMLEA